MSRRRKGEREESRRRKRKRRRKNKKRRRMRRKKRKRKPGYLGRQRDNFSHKSASLLSGTPLGSLFLTPSTPLDPLSSQCLVNRTVWGKLSHPSQLPHTAALFQPLLHNRWAQAWTSLGRILDNRLVTKRL